MSEKDDRREVARIVCAYVISYAETENKMKEAQARGDSQEASRLNDWLYAQWDYSIPTIERFPLSLAEIKAAYAEYRTHRVPSDLEIRIALDALRRRQDETKKKGA